MIDSVRPSFLKTASRGAGDEGKTLQRCAGPFAQQKISIRDIAKRGEPEVFRTISVESQRNGTSKLTADEIDRIVKITRAQKKEC